MRLVLIFLISSLQVCCQTNDEKVIIRNFIKNLHNPKIEAEFLIDNYMYTEDWDDKSIKNFEVHIKLIRTTKQNENLGWLVPKSIDEYVISRYSEYKNMTDLNLNVSPEIENRIYILMNPEKTQILQYLLLNKGKIQFFALFVKGKEADFFGY